MPIILDTRNIIMKKYNNNANTRSIIKLKNNEKLIILIT